MCVTISRPVRAASPTYEPATGLTRIWAANSGVRPRWAISVTVPSAGSSWWTPPTSICASARTTSSISPAVATTSAERPMLSATALSASSSRLRRVSSKSVSERPDELRVRRPAGSPPRLSTSAAPALMSPHAPRITSQAIRIFRRPSLPSATRTHSRPGPDTVTWLAGRTRKSRPPSRRSLPEAVAFAHSVAGTWRVETMGFPWSRNRMPGRSDAPAAPRGRAGDGAA